MKLSKKLLAIVMAIVMLMGCVAVSASAAGTEQTRYSVLVLDVSGSMYGQPIEALKEAATAFCEQVLDSSKGYDKNNQIAIVTFETYSDVICEFTNDVAELKTAINQIRDEDMTNLAAGINSAHDLLSQIPENNVIKNILIMCDGYPNEGYPDGETAAYEAAANIPMNWNIYGLYFGQNGGDPDAYKVMENVCRTECYDASNFDELIVVFAEDWTGEVTTSGANNLVIRIACPVEVSVELNGTILDRNNPKTLFGTLEFEGSGDDEVKILKLSYSDNYKISVVGTGTGTMNYSISYRINDEEVYSLTYPTIDITPETNIFGIVNFDDKTITLDVDENGDGTIDNKVTGTASDEVATDDQSIDKSKLNFFQRIKLFFKERFALWLDNIIRIATLYKSFI